MTQAIVRIQKMFLFYLRDEDLLLVLGNVINRSIYLHRWGGGGGGATPSPLYTQAQVHTTGKNLLLLDLSVTSNFHVILIALIHLTFGSVKGIENEENIREKSGKSGIFEVDDNWQP